MKARGGFVSAAALSWLVAACGTGSDGNGRGMPTSPTADQGEAVLKQIGLVRPRNATVEYVDEEHGIDDNASIILSMPAADWVRMRSAPPLNTVDPTQFSSGDNYELGPDRDRWTPRQDPSVKALQIPWRDGREWLNIGVGNGRGGNVRVYLYWYTV